MQVVNLHLQKQNVNCDWVLVRKQGELIGQLKTRGVDSNTLPGWLSNCVMNKRNRCGLASSGLNTYLSETTLATSRKVVSICRVTLYCISDIDMQPQKLLCWHMLDFQAKLFLFFFKTGNRILYKAPNLSSYLRHVERKIWYKQQVQFFTAS